MILLLIVRSTVLVNVIREIDMYLGFSLSLNILLLIVNH